MATILSINVNRALDINGLSVPGAQATFYDSGTTSIRQVYTDPAGTIPHPTPVLANGAGVFPPIYDSGDGDAKVAITDAGGSMLAGYPIDPVPRVTTDVTGAAAVSFEPTAEIPDTNVQAAIERVQANAVEPLADFGLGVTGNSTLLANIDATNTGSGAYRYDGTTAGTFPAGVVRADGGTVRVWRENASAAVMVLTPRNSPNQFIRPLSGSWGAWQRVISSADTASNAVWAAGNSGTVYAISPVNLKAGVAGALNAEGGAPVYGIRAWATINGRTTNGACTIAQGGNVASAERVGVGTYRVNFATAMPHPRYGVFASTNDVRTERVSGKLQGYVELNFNSTAGGEPLLDPDIFHIQVVC